MKGMPWQDIMPASKWEDVLSNYMRFVTETAIDLPPLPGRPAAGLFRAFKKRRSPTIRNTPQQCMQISGLIVTYHRIPKPEAARIYERIGMLKTIAMLAEQALAGLRFTGDTPMDRAKIKKNGGQETLEWALSKLARRGKRKAAYLQELMKHVVAGDKGFANLADGNGLLDFLRREKANFDASRPEGSVVPLGLIPRELLESIDPWHRPYNLQDSQNPRAPFAPDGSLYGAAFFAWALGHNDIPFFLWLEDTFLCTGVFKYRRVQQYTEEINPATQNLRYRRFRERGHHAPRYEHGEARYTAWYQTTRVEGREYSEHSSAWGINMIHPEGGFLKKVNFEPNGNIQYELMDTYGTPGKEPDAWAYVYSLGGTIFAAPHVEAGLHHSSFLAGTKVWCAGMIKVRAGKVIYIDNGSGHYTPPQRNLIAFIQGLQTLRVFDATATVFDYEFMHKNARHGQGSRPLPPDPPLPLNDFLANPPVKHP